MFTINRMTKTYLYAGQFLLTLDPQRAVVKARMNGKPETEVSSTMHYDIACRLIAMPVPVREQAIADFANWACFHTDSLTVIA